MLTPGIASNRGWGPGFEHWLGGCGFPGIVCGCSARAFEADADAEVRVGTVDSAQNGRHCCEFGGGLL